jgi:uncharacterized membrane protein YccC
MSLETSIDNLAQAIAALAQALAQAPDQRTTDEGVRRVRRTKAQIAADEAAARGEAPPSEAPVEAPAPEAPPPTQDDVRAALMAVRNQDGSPERAKAILQRLAGSEKLSDAPVSQFAAIIAECRKLVA